MIKRTDCSLRMEEITRSQVLNDTDYISIVDNIGKGFVYGCVLNFTSKFFYFKVIVDGVTIIDGLDYDILIDSGALNLDELSTMPRWIYCHRSAASNYGLCIEFPGKMSYKTSFEIQAKTHAGKAVNLDFGLVVHEVG